MGYQQAVEKHLYQGKLICHRWGLRTDRTKNAHPGGVNGVAWVDGNTRLVSAGADGCVRTWTVPEL